MDERADRMRAAIALVDDAGRSDVAEQLAADVGKQLGERRADLCLLFSTAHFEDELEEIAGKLYERLSPRAFVGATGESIVCGQREYEQRPAMTLWAAHLPYTRLSSFHLSQHDLERFDEPAAWHDYLGVRPDEDPKFILLGDPLTLNVLEMLERFEAAYPGRPAIGGLASAAEAPGQNVMIFDGQALHHGLCGVALRGNVEIDTVVSQGCRPIGRHLVITEAERNIIRELGGKPPLAVLVETLRQCSTHDIELARTGGLLLGRAIDERQEEFTRGDFLVRNPIGFERDSGAMMINDLVRTGQTVQFHVRDSESAADDLVSLLGAKPRGPVAGALLFTCNARGSRLFKERHHDARAVAQSCHARPAAGLFCAGEIGPIGRRNYLHSHTACIGFFRPVDDPSEA